MQTRISSELIHVPAYEAHAKLRLNPDIWDYLSGGAEQERTVQRNNEAWQEKILVPRRLSTVLPFTTQASLLGDILPHPILLAPVAHQKLFCETGELAAAMAAAATYSPLIISSLASCEFAAIRQAAGDAQLWFQLYWQGNRRGTFDLLQRAMQLKPRAIVLTVDAPHAGIRDRERLSGFTVPAYAAAINLSPQPLRQAEEAGNITGNAIAGLTEWLAGCPNWEDIRWLSTQVDLPILLKGILHPEDAIIAMDAGVSGIIVSNHGGRVLEGCISTAEALPAICAICPPDFPVLVDGGIRRGSDILRALCSGATAVLIGRPYIYGLAVAGALGAAHVIQLLRQELEVNLLNSGLNTIVACRQATLLA